MKSIDLAHISGKSISWRYSMQVTFDLYKGDSNAITNTPRLS
ncbi:hypothetical protein AC99_4837 [Escherichia coli 2-222-05_S4_C2]|nr:hypothetical protein AC99_4837 [Escherichia coli 2-222-05_S4_C2]